VIACQTENNVPVVGKAEIINAREMHWIRIDRYYSTDADTKDKSMGNYKKMEDPSDNPEVVFLPVMCQHCNNAPCETVCPVVATTHSSEGLNQMTYNRCVGTRYCANNCPFKVRRFNWFNYTNDEKFTTVNFMSQSDLGKMVLNPDVTVRSRGVMEKCSLCVQRIQAGKLEAKKEKRKLKDGDIVTACQQSCPADAIIFGDMNDPESRIAQTLGITKNEQKDVVLGEERAYHLLEEINVKANVTYLAKIRNKA
jgi:molybdopterin-containing oxidoreductase family iron-sulfur binding subunit